MATKAVLLLALFCFVLVGQALAADDHVPAPEGRNDHNEAAVAEAPDAGSDGFAVAGPIGGPVPDGAFQESGSSTTSDASHPPEAGKSSAVATFQFSALPALAAVSGFFSLF